MKKNHSIKKALLQATFAGSVLLFVACESQQNQEDSKEIAIEHNDSKFEDNIQEQKDAQFLVNVAEINLKEIQLGQLAQQNGATLHVKELGKMMEDAHAQSQKDLNALAESKNITIPNSPSEDSNDTYTKLNDKSGNDFDKAYTDKMVSAHKDAIDVFEEAVKESNDPEIKKWAKTTLTELRKHLDQSTEYQNKHKKSK